MTVPKFAKTQVDCYKIFNLPHDGWAVIVIDDQENRGRVMISSDYGNFNNYWDGCGCSLKEFLPKMNLDYAAEKFRQDEWFDSDATVSMYRQLVIESRRYGSMKKETAARIWGEIEKLDGLDQEDFVGRIRDMDALMGYFDNFPEFSYGVHPMFRKFWDEVWLPLMDEFKKELSEVPAVRIVESCAAVVDISRPSGNLSAAPENA